MRFSCQRPFETVALRSIGLLELNALALLTSDHSLSPLSFAVQRQLAELRQQLLGPLTLRMAHTRDGARIGIVLATSGASYKVSGEKRHSNDSLMVPGLTDVMTPLGGAGVLLGSDSQSCPGQHLNHS